MSRGSTISTASSLDSINVYGMSYPSRRAADDTELNETPASGAPPSTSGASAGSSARLPAPGPNRTTQRRAAAAALALVAALIGLRAIVRSHGRGS